MRTPPLLSVLAAFALVLPAASASAQEKGAWRAASTTARAITGDIALSADKLTINFYGYTIAEIRPLTPAEIAGVFGPDSAGTGHLYRLKIPANRKFLKGNTLCGSDDTQWMATLLTGRSLQIAFFSGPAIPVFTAAAIADSTSLCGTFSYAR